MKTAIARTLKPAACRGFTLLEMCIVLFIIALLAGVAMPAMNSAFVERALRNDSHAFSLLAKTAMIRSSEDQRPYVLTLDGKELTLAPVDVHDASAPADAPAETEVVPMTQTLDNALKLPDATTSRKWDTLTTVSWTFEPDGLCPLPRLRFERGDSYIEMGFNALTGDVEDEAENLP